MDITEVSRRSGVPASTLRFYEEKGLIASIGRRGLHRLFDPGVLERLALITLGRSVGFTLDEIARMFGADGRPRIDRRLLAAKADELDRVIRRLSTMRRSLRHAAACPAPSHMECPTFRRLLGLATSEMSSKGKREARSKKSRANPPRRTRQPGKGFALGRSGRSGSVAKRASVSEILRKPGGFRYESDASCRSVAKRARVSGILRAGRLERR